MPISIALDEEQLTQDIVDAVIPQVQIDETALTQNIVDAVIPQVEIDEAALTQSIVDAVIPQVGSSFPAPFVRELEPFKFDVNQTKEILLEGAHFTFGMAISSPGLTINSRTFIDDNKVVIDATAIGTVGNYDLILDNGTEAIVSNAISILDTPWVDYRSGGSSLTYGTDIVVTNRIDNGDIRRTANGMWFDGASQWRSAVELRSLEFTRGNRTTVEIIVNNYNNRYLIGVGRQGRNINSSAQFYEAEVGVYINNNYLLYRLYGNRNIKEYYRRYTSGGLIKLVISDDCQIGSRWYLYKLNSTDSNQWNDRSNLIFSSVLDDRFAYAGNTLYPLFLPRNSSNSLLVAARIY